MNQKSRHLWTRLQGGRAFGALSGSAELTEDRAVVERHLKRAAEVVVLDKPFPHSGNGNRPAALSIPPRPFASNPAKTGIPP